MYDGMDAVFHKKLKEVVEAELAAQREQVSRGQLEPYEYKHRGGQVVAYERVLAWAAEIQKKMNASD